MKIKKDSAWVEILSEVKLVTKNNTVSVEQAKMCVEEN